MEHSRVVVAPVAREPVQRSAIVERARQRGFTRFALPEGKGGPRGSAGETYAWDGRRLRGRARSGQAFTTEVATISSPAELQSFLRRAPAGGVALARWSRDRIIPLENALAQRERTSEIWVLTSRVSEVSAALGALEHGADTVLVEVSQVGEVDTLEGHLDRVLPPRGSWELVPIQRVVPVGLGDRIIVDTTFLLQPTEGLLVGSAAAFLLHVASEAVGSAFTRPRPFRVNAGAAHSYTLLADGTTRYLSELRPGDAVLVADPAGSYRSVRVGRIKTERRPLCMVEVLRKDRLYTVFLQDAETVRLSAGSARLATTDLRPGAKVYGMALPAARHLGTAIQETIDEF